MDDATSSLTNPSNLIFGFGRRFASPDYFHDVSLPHIVRRKCVASAFADANAYLVISNVIATMNISRARDERGFEIDPPHAYKSGFTQYVSF